MKACVLELEEKRHKIAEMRRLRLHFFRTKSMNLSQSEGGRIKRKADGGIEMTQR